MTDVDAVDLCAESDRTVVEWRKGKGKSEKNALSVLYYVLVTSETENSEKSGG